MLQRCLKQCGARKGINRPEWTLHRNMSEDSTCKFKQAIEDCLLPKLSKSYDEAQQHVEYDIRNNNLDKTLPFLRDFMKKIDLKPNDSNTLDIVSSLMILNIELKTEGPWNSSSKIRDCAKLLDYDFQTLYGTTYYSLLQSNAYFNSQDILGLCLEKLHAKLTQDFKKYPSLVEVYCQIIQEVEKSKIKVIPSKTLPISLLLTDDYIYTNKTKGLTCCLKILQNLTPMDFDDSNYHEVIYRSLSNLLHDKGLTNTKLLLLCLIEYLKVLPHVVKIDKTDDLFRKVLNEINMETNFERKAAFLEFIPKFIAFHGVHCVKEKKKFNTIITENLDLCTNENIRKPLLGHLLQCLQSWVQFCWCAWNYNTDWKVLSVLLKIHCVIKKSDIHIEEVLNLIGTLIYLSAEDEKEDIMSRLKYFYCKNEEITKLLRNM